MKKEMTTSNFYVMKGDGCSLLGYKTAKELGHMINCVSSSSKQMSADELVDSYPDLFHGMGKKKKRSSQTSH